MQRTGPSCHGLPADIKAFVALLAAAGGAASARAAPTCVDGVCFVDRGASGEIDLGYIRGGLAVLDFDNDGFMDLVVADSAGRSSRLFRNVADSGRPGWRTFEDVTVGSGLDDAEGVTTDSFGVVAADYDNDGSTDVLMTGSSAPGGFGLLYRNNGDGTFTNVSVAAGVRLAGAGPLSASFNDFDLDGQVDILFVGAGFGPNSRRLLRNNGDGTFSDATTALPPVVGVGFSYAHTWMDHDDDGFMDLVIPYTDVPTVLRNVPDATFGRRFLDVSQVSGFTVLGPAPMGIAAGDYDGDGDMDIAVTDAVVGTYYENVGGLLTRVFPMRTIFGWGVTWLDVDNDGRLDNYQCGSHGGSNLDRLHRNRGGRQFDDITPALNGLSLASQHTVQVDINNDGRQDLITVNPGTFNQPISVYENVSTTNHHWLTIRLRSDSPDVNADAVGAVVRVTAGGVTQVRQVVSGSSTAAAEDPRTHFGLGGADVVDAIEVLWPFLGNAPERTVRYEGPIPVDQIVSLSYPPVDCNGNGVDDGIETALSGADCNGNAAVDNCEDIGPGDFNGDGAANRVDGIGLASCVTGPGDAAVPPPAGTACAPFCHEVYDSDGDEDVDLSDVAAKQNAIAP